MDKKEAIQSVFKMADAIESEFGSADYAGAYREARELLLALGVSEEDLAEYDDECRKKDEEVRQRRAANGFPEPAC